MSGDLVRFCISVFGSLSLNLLLDLEIVPLGCNSFFLSY
jgi:hypothetical protein